MGQFSELFNELENAEAKAQPKPNAAKGAKRSPEKRAKPANPTPPTKTLQTVKSKLKAAKLSNNGNTTTTENAAPMRGKRSHPDYTQAPAFVRKDTYKAVKIALLNAERGLDYSDLVEGLLTAWLKNNR